MKRDSNILPSVIKGLKVLKILLDDSNTIQEIATELQTNERSIYRYIRAIKKAGFEVYKDNVDGKKVYSSTVFKNQSK